MANNIPGMRKGYCINIGNCDKANTKEEITIGIGEEFVCPDCGGTLAEIKKKPIPIWIWGVVALVVLGGAGAGAYFGGLFEKKEILVKEIMIDSELYTLKVDEELIINARIEPLNATNGTLSFVVADENIAKVENGILKGLKAGKTQLTLTSADGMATKTIEVKVEAKPTSTGGGGVSYPTVGTFSGKLKNGYPNGTGTLTFQSQRLIDAHDTKNRIAQPGDYLIGEWDNGHLIQARWYDGSTNQLKETIVLGKCMNPEKDHSLGRFRKQ